MIATGSSTADYRQPLDYFLFGAAVFLLGLAALTVRCLSFARMFRWMERVGETRTPAIAADRIVLSVKRAQRRVPWRTVCIHQGIAAHVLLRMAGHRSQFVYGMASSPELVAHVWVRVEGAIVIGGDASTECVEVAAVP